MWVCAHMVEELQLQRGQEMDNPSARGGGSEPFLNEMIQLLSQRAYTVLVLF